MLDALVAETIFAVVKSVKNMKLKTEVVCNREKYLRVKLNL